MSLYIVEGDFAMLGGAGEEVSESLRSGRNRLDFDDLVGDAMPGGRSRCRIPAFSSTAPKDPQFDRQCCRRSVNCRDRCRNRTTGN